MAETPESFARFVLTLDDPRAVGLRASITLSEIIERAREALANPNRFEQFGHLVVEHFGGYTEVQHSGNERGQEGRVVLDGDIPHVDGELLDWIEDQWRGEGKPDEVF